MQTTTHALSYVFTCTPYNFQPDYTGILTVEHLTDQYGRQAVFFFLLAIELN